MENEDSSFIAKCKIFQPITFLGEHFGMFATDTKLAVSLILNLNKHVSKTKKK